MWVEKYFSLLFSPFINIEQFFAFTAIEMFFFLERWKINPYDPVLYAHPHTHKLFIPFLKDFHPHTHVRVSFSQPIEIFPHIERLSIPEELL